MKKLRFILLCLPALVFLLQSCQKGDTGPAGATGPAGPAGPTGAQGPAGTANVKTDTFSLTNANWIYSGIYYVGVAPNVSSGYFTKYYDYVIPRMTDSFLVSGTVLVYFNSEPDLYPNVWSPMPFSFTAGAGYAYNYVFETLPGKIRLHFFFNKVSVDPPALSTYTIPNHKFKIITIAGNIGGRIANTQLPDPRDYLAVCRYYGITP